MLENVSWMQLIKDSLLPKLAADPEGGLSTFLGELDKIVAQVKGENEDGFKRCKLVLTRQQVANGDAAWVWPHK